MPLKKVKKVLQKTTAGKSSKARDKQNEAYKKLLKKK
jgi:hypothetical protein